MPKDDLMVRGEVVRTPQNVLHNFGTDLKRIIKKERET
jgi:hypothetical protein